MYNHNPSPEELAEWFQIAQRRNAVLPERIRVEGRNVAMLCGNPECTRTFSRKLLPNRNDPVFVCPSCKVRNYVPIEW